jgi:hypothetical protein
MTTQLLIPEHVSSLNGQGGMLRAHWSKKAKIIKTYQWVFLAQTSNRHPGQVRLSVTRLSLKPTMDYDNLVGCYKHYLDAIVKAGIIQDDGPKIIIESRYEQLKATSKQDQQTLIVIECA